MRGVVWNYEGYGGVSMKKKSTGKDNWNLGHFCNELQNLEQWKLQGIYVGDSREDSYQCGYRA